MERAHAEEATSEPAVESPQGHGAAATPPRPDARDRARAPALDRQPRRRPHRPRADADGDHAAQLRLGRHRDLHRHRPALPARGDLAAAGHRGDGPRQRDGQAGDGDDRGRQGEGGMVDQGRGEAVRRGVRRGGPRRAERDPPDAQGRQVREGRSQARGDPEGRRGRPRRSPRSTSGSSRSCSTRRARPSAPTTTPSPRSPTSSTSAAPSSTSGSASSRCRATSAAR
jgi:hypothetical protein